MYNRYSKSKITNHIRTTLPLEDFTKGNFSRAGEIIDAYENFLRICLSESKNRVLQGKNMQKYLDDELNSLNLEKEKLESELKEILNKIDEFNKIVNALKKEKKNNKKREAIWKKFKEMKWDTNEFEDFLNALKKSNPDNYKQGEEDINEFLNSHNYEKIKKRYQENSMRQLKTKRNGIVRKLNHKGNSMNIEKLIEEIKTGKTKNMLEKYIFENTEQSFGKEKNNFYQEDSRSLKEIYRSELTSMIILNKNSNAKLKEELIKKFNDKIGLWDYIWDIYGNLKLNENRIRENLGIENNVGINLYEEMKKSIIEEIKYWVNFCKEQYPMWLNAIVDSDIENLKEILDGKKEHAWNIEISENRRIREIFYTLRDYLEHSELENKFEMIWNYDYMGIDTNIGNLKNILKYLFKYMGEEDRKDVKERYEHWNKFKDIEEENKIENSQLKLFN